MIYKLKLIFLIFFLYGHVAHAISIEDFKNLEGQSSFKVQKVNKYIDYFSQNRKGRDFFQAAYPRLGLYRDIIYEIFDEYNIPKEIIFVSMLESGFNPKIESSAGAIGLWQFMPSTAEIFGLRIDEWVDERMDIYYSTNAAVSYFKSLLKKFGSWELALAGYNCGDLNVKKAIDKYNSTDFWYLSKYTFPKQTKEYVPQIIALIHISENLKKYNFGYLELKKNLKVKKFKVPENTKLSKIAYLIGETEDYVNNINPSLQKKITPPNESYDINIPINKIEILYSKIDVIFKDRVIKKYKIIKGDTLSKIAIKLNNSVEELYDLNDLDSSKIFAGKYLLFYENDKSLFKIGKYWMHVVKRGDSLYKLSKTYEVSIDNIKKWNNISGSKIIIGQKIKLILKNE